MKLIQPIEKLDPTKLLEFLKSKFEGIEVKGTKPEQIDQICSLDDTTATASSITFIRSKDKHQISKNISQSNAGIFLASNLPETDLGSGKWVIAVKEPQLAYVAVMEKFFLDREEEFMPKEIHSTAVIDTTAQIGEGAKIGAYVVIGAHCKIGANVTIHPHAVIYHHASIGAGTTIHSHAVIREHCIVGPNCYLQPGAVIGGEGFGYTQDPKSGLKAVPQIGIVELAANVDVGSNTCIDRAASGSTKIGLGTKIDNQVQIGHNVEIGKHSAICGQVGIGGSTVIGDGVVLAGQVGVGDHLKVASGVRVGGAGVIIYDVEEPGDYMGYPVQLAFKWRRILAAQVRLPDILKAFRGKKDGKG